MGNEDRGRVVCPVGRFAPSPSGRMHLGNLFTALFSWLSVKSRGGRWILRIEDLDPQRSKREHAQMIEEDLLWLGLEWDEGGLAGRGTAGPYLQSLRGEIYERYLAQIKSTGLVYPCTCTKADILATSAPHGSDGRVVYGGRCRPAMLPGAVVFPDRPHAARLYVPDREVVVVDRVYGEQRVNLARECGDFVLRRADGAWAYQHAVVVDDALMGVTEVVRGSDLLQSAAQQSYLYECLGFAEPEWMHVPLLCNLEGRRLSKRDGSLSMASLCERHTVEEVLGYLAFVGGLIEENRPASLAELVEIFDPARLRPVATVKVDF